MDIEDQFLNWTKQWDKAVKDGIFSADTPAKANKEVKQDFFGQLNIDQESEPNEKDVSYWNNINNYEESFDLLTEEKGIIKKTKKIAKSSNSVDYKTLGPDSKNNPSEWGHGGKFDKLVELKQKLHDLNVSLTSKETLGEKADQLKKEIDKLLTNIDDISDDMTSLRFKSEPE